MDHLLKRRGFIVMDGAKTKVLGFAVKDPYATADTENPWVPLSLGSERTFTQLASVRTRYQAEKAVRASWGVQL